MTPILKIELLYYLYRFGCKRHIVNINPLVIIPIDNLMNPLGFEDFKVEFVDLCKRWSYTEDYVYSKVKGVIDLLVEGGQFNFNLN